MTQMQNNYMNVPVDIRVADKPYVVKRNGIDIFNIDRKLCTNAVHEMTATQYETYVLGELKGFVRDRPS